MKKKELFVFQEGLKQAGIATGQPFVFVRLRNKKKIDDICETIKESNKPSEEFEAYDKERIELCEKYAEYDSETGGAKVSSHGAYVIAKDKKEIFDKEFAELKAANKELLDIRETQREEYLKLLDEDFDLDKEDFVIHKVKADDIPTNLNGNVLDLIEYMIELDEPTYTLAQARKIIEEEEKKRKKEEEKKKKAEEKDSKKKDKE